MRKLDVFTLLPLISGCSSINCQIVHVLPLRQTRCKSIDKVSDSTCIASLPDKMQVRRFPRSFVWLLPLCAFG